MPYVESMLKIGSWFIRHSEPRQVWEEATVNCVLMVSGTPDWSAFNIRDLSFYSEAACTAFCI